jgi:hypothetical protein
MFKDKNLRLYEALGHEIAVDAAERRELTPDQEAISRRMLAFAHARVDQRERALSPRRAKVRPEIAAMERPSLLQRLSDLLSVQPNTVFAHRDLTELSDDDLRITLEDAESMLEKLV